MSEPDDLGFHIRSAWHRMTPFATWRGVSTGWNGLDLLTLGEVVHQSKPAVAVVAGGLGMGGVAWFVADCMEHNRRGKVLAGEKMGTERLRTMPEHRRIQWLPLDLLVDDFRTAQRLTERAWPVLVVTAPHALRDTEELARLVTVGSHLVVHGDTAVEQNHYPRERFVLDLSRDPAGLSACSWLLRVPA